MIKPIFMIASLAAVMPSALAQSPIVDVPTSPDHPLAKSVGWVETAPQSATAAANGSIAAAYQARRHLQSTRAPRRKRGQDTWTSDQSAAELNQYELDRISAETNTPTDR